MDLRPSYTFILHVCAWKALKSFNLSTFLVSTHNAFEYPRFNCMIKYYGLCDLIFPSSYKSIHRIKINNALTHVTCLFWNLFLVACFCEPCVLAENVLAKSYNFKEHPKNVSMYSKTKMQKNFDCISVAASAVLCLCFHVCDRSTDLISRSRNWIRDNIWLLMHSHH